MLICSYRNKNSKWSFPIKQKGGKVVETIFDKKDQAAVEEVIDFIKTLSVEEQKQVQIFIQGIKFAQAAAKKDPAA